MAIVALHLEEGIMEFLAQLQHWLQALENLRLALWITGFLLVLLAVVSPLRTKWFEIHLTWPQKSVLSVLGAFCLMGAIAVHSKPVLIQSGEEPPYGHTRSDWTLHHDPKNYPTVDGLPSLRTFERSVKFAKAFEKEPKIQLSMYHIDATPNGFDTANTPNIRISLSAFDIDKNGFKIRITTWDASRIWGAGVAWLAYQP
jgi:hypothetical protein